MKKVDQSWRRRAYPVQVRVRRKDDETKWALYSRHRDWGEAQRRAMVEAENQFGAGWVDVVDIRDCTKPEGA
jgi:hypothetical protein